MPLMRSPSHNWLLRLLVLPLWALLVGFVPGRWYCADGRPCEVTTAVVCCCGCTEFEGLPSHVSEVEGERTRLTAGECGCYRQSVRPDALAVRPSVFDDVAAPATLPSPWALAVLQPVPGPTVVATAHSPPRYWPAAADPRGPPIA